MYKEHEYGDNDRCIHCSGLKSLIAEHKWSCNPIDSKDNFLNEKRVEISWDYKPLTDFLIKIPGVNEITCESSHIDNNWYVCFRIDITHDKSWHVVQLIGSILNPTHECARFYPMSPSVDLNGGPFQHLYWIIESTSTDFTPENCSVALHNWMPQPVEDISQWDYD